MVVRLFESLRAVFYAPYYVAMALDAFAEQGVEVALGRPDRPDDAAASLFSGGSDVTWGGPMRMMQYLDRHPEARLVGFAEAVTRDPFYLIGRAPRPDFRPRDLLAVRAATVSEVPTPWLCLQDDLRRDGAEPDRVERVADRTMAENAEALRRGEVDVVQVFEPFAELLIDEGAGHLWYAAAARGPTTYTTLYTTGAFAEANPAVLEGMTAAVHRAQTWLHRHPAEEIAALIGPYFPDLASARLAGAVQRYLEHGIWGRDPVLPVVGFVRLKCALLSGGFIGRDIPFESCIDNRYALKVASALASAG